jgi:hypothetical protein
MKRGEEFYREMQATSRERRRAQRAHFYRLI